MSLPHNTRAVLPAAVITLALTLAGCGGYSSSSSSSPPKPSHTGSAKGTSFPRGATAISTAEVPGVGTVLVDSAGFTVYSFAKDRGTMSSCYGACAAAWPPVTAAGEHVSETGALSARLGTTRRKDGTLQLTYGGQPLYTFVQDRNPGEAHGNGVDAFGGVWSILTANGSATAGRSGEGGGGSSGGYGY